MCLESIHNAIYLLLLFFIAITLNLNAKISLNNNDIKSSTLVNNTQLTDSSLITKDAFFAQHEKDEFLNFQNNIELNEDLALNQHENKLEFDFDENEENIPLLPKNISFMENALWGESGVFRTIGITSALTPDQRQKELKWRRTFLTLHQTAGLLSWGLMAGTVVTGQLWLDGKMDSPNWHKRLLYSTIGIYSLTGLLAIITPPPYERRDEFSTISFHKLAAWVHFAGMIATPLLGNAINNTNDYYKSAQIHQTMGYVTFSVYSAAMLAILLFE